MQDPFNNPFHRSLHSSTSDIFRRRGGGGGVRPVRKSETAAEPVSEGVEVRGTEEESAGTVSESQVILKNPRWEVEKVGFNEETSISIEADLPEEQAHKTKVAFEVFAKTPEGVESISKADGNLTQGKAVAKVPIYIPQYRDEEGNLLSSVEYFFSAEHSASKPIKDEAVVKRVEEMATLLIESHILADATFATGSSQVLPDQVPKLKELAERVAEWKEEHPDGKLVVFGHADAEGKPEPNKKVSERRAKCIHAFLVKDASTWDALAREEKWDKQAIPDFKVVMEENNSLSLSGKDFDAIDGKAFAGCSEFNQVEQKQGSHAPNRRVSVFLIKSSKNFPIRYPCKQGDVGPCKAHAGRKGARRTAGFSCLFYDKLLVESVKVSEPTKPHKAAAVEIEDVHFGHDDALPLLSSPGSMDADPFLGLNAYAGALVHLSKNAGLSFKIYGHADTSGSDSHNLELSRRRALAVKAILDGDENAFVKIALGENGDDALQHYLDCFQNAFSWPLEADGGDGDESARVRAFQESFNAEHEGNLKVDGKIGPKTWGAIFHLLKEQIGMLIEAKGGNLADVRARYVSDGGGIEACGEKFPLDAAERDGFRSQKNRRVEIAFLPMDKPKPRGRKELFLEPIVITVDKLPLKNPTGELTGIEASCQRKDGPRVAPPGVDLEIVPDPVTGDAIRLQPQPTGKVQSEWAASGWTEDKYSGRGEWKTKVRGFKRPGEQFWIPHFNPHVVTVKASGPGGKEFTKLIKAYPGDQGFIEIGAPNWIERFEKVLGFFRKYLGSKFELELLKGSLSGSTGFKEAKSSPEVFWSWALEGGFSPLIGGKYRFKADAIAFMNFIPDRVKKYAGEIIVFADFKGGVNLTLAYSREDVDYKVENLKVQGVVSVSVGMEASAIKQKVLKVLVQGTTGLSVSCPGFYNDDKGMGIKADFEFPGITAEGAFELFDGWVTTKYSAVLMEKHEFETQRLGTDFLQ